MARLRSVELPRCMAARHLPLAPPFLAKLSQFFGQSKQGACRARPASLESCVRVASGNPTGSLPPLLALAARLHVRLGTRRADPLAGARLPFHELAQGRRGRVPAGWKPPAGSERVTSVARSTSLGPRPTACNPQSRLEPGLSPS